VLSKKFLPPVSFISNVIFHQAFSHNNWPMSKMKGKNQVPICIPRCFVKWLMNGNPPVFAGSIRRTYAAIFSFWAAAMPPMGVVAQI